MSKHDESQRQVESLIVGSTVHVRSGAGRVTLVALGPIKDASKGTYAGLTVLHTTEDEFFPFATHTLYYQDDGDTHQGWHMYGGQSYRNLTDAVESFTAMTGKQP